MNKCEPVEMRKNIEFADVLSKAGIDFVAIPVGGKLTKEVLLAMVTNQLEELERIS